MSGFRFLLRLLVSIALLFSAPWARAGIQHVDCRHPIVFPGSAVNVVVLPYRHMGTTEASLSDAGKRLSLLVKLDNLYHILPYGSIGSVQMELPPGVEDDPGCHPDAVMSRLLSGDPAIQPGRGLVLVWGLIYEQDEDIFVQTYTRFLRRDRNEEITLKVQDASFYARPSSQAVSFPPRQITRNNLAEIEQSYQQIDYMRARKSDNAPGEPLTHPLAKCSGGGECEDVHSAYWVDRSEGEWIHVTLQNPSQGLRSGWIHARIGMGGRSLDMLLPELHFIRGVAGYLRQRAGEDGSAAPAPDVTRRLALEEFLAFEKSVEPEEAELAVAVAKQLSGIMRLGSNPEPSEKALAVATEDFKAAQTLIPYSPEAANLAVVAKISQDFRKPGSQDVRSKERELAQAASLSRTNAAAVDNLKSFYGLVLKSDRYSGLDKQETQRRLERINKIERVPTKQIAAPEKRDARPVDKRVEAQPQLVPRVVEQQQSIKALPDYKRQQQTLEPEQSVAYPPQLESAGKTSVMAGRSAASQVPVSSRSNSLMSKVALALVPAYNLPGITAPLQFTPDILTGIFFGRIRMWNDPVIGKANPGLSLPPMQITVIRPTSQEEIDRVFADYLTTTNCLKRRPVRSEPGWYGADLGTLERVVMAIKSKPGAISVVPSAQAEQQKLTHGAILH